MKNAILVLTLLLLSVGCTVHTHHYTCTGSACPQPQVVVVQPAPQQVGYRNTVSCSARYDFDQQVAGCQRYGQNQQPDVRYYTNQNVRTRIHHDNRTYVRDEVQKRERRSNAQDKVRQDNRPRKHPNARKCRVMNGKKFCGNRRKRRE